MEGWEGNSTELGNSMGDRVMVDKLVLKKCCNVARLLIVVQVSDRSLALLEMNLTMVVEACKPDQPRYECPILKQVQTYSKLIQVS